MANEEQLAILKQGVDVWNQWREENPDIQINLDKVDFSGGNIKAKFRDLSGINLSRANLRGVNLSDFRFDNANLKYANLNGAILWGSHFGQADLSSATIYRANLTEASLRKALLISSNLELAILGQANLKEANLSDANLRGANLKNAFLDGANLRTADLFGANLWGSNLYETNFQAAHLSGVDFRESNLSGSNLREADLIQASLSGANLSKVDFTKSEFRSTILGNNDISSCAGLETIQHFGPSTIGTDTIQKSQGKIPVDFLRGCGLSDIEIEFAKLANPELTAQEVSEITQKIFDLKETQAVQIFPIFISYSHADSTFVDRIETKLNEKGIRFWRDIHDATAGRLETQIDRAIRHNPTVLLILSEHSTSSDWVEHEARLARKLEKDLGRDVLCPIALDDSWKTCNWPERIKEQIMEYNILDFSNWEDDAELDTMFKRLIDGLDMFYKG